MWKKKKNSWCYHLVHGWVDMNKLLHTHGWKWKSSWYNTMTTKIVSGHKDEYFVNNILRDVYDGEFKSFVMAK